jgi:hypothetical protein
MGLDMYLYVDDEQVAYWRKANSVHKWFVDKLGAKNNLEQYPVSIERLQQLKDLCRLALETRNSELLPPTSGFFFGSTDIDDYYWSDLEFTIEKIDKVIAETPKNKRISYLAWW